MTDFSYQLYSSRNYPPLNETLRMLGHLGYTQVEGYGDLFAEGFDAQALRANLDAACLAMPTAHMDLDAIRNQPKRVISIAKELGIEAIFGPYLAVEVRPKTPDCWTAFGTHLGEIAKPLQDAGLQFGWHNHDFEFTPVDGEVPIELILDAAPGLQIEFDLAWCARAGGNPVAWAEIFSDRILAAHIKDIAAPGEAEDEDGWADVGHGVLDWPAAMAALRNSACRYFVAEHDNPSDHQRFASRSLAAMRDF